MNKERTKESAQPSDRPKWRRAVARACQRGKEAKEKIEDPSQDQPKWWRSGSVNLFGPYPYLYPCLYGHPCPCPYSCLSFPLWGIFTFLGCNSEKRSILSQGGGITFGAFGWAFARADSSLRRRFTFHWSLLKAGIYCARRGSRGRRSPRGEKSPQWHLLRHHLWNLGSFFFGLCCARHNDSGSHEDML